MRYEETTLRRDCEAIVIPYGDREVLPAGTDVVITQALGDSFTIQVPTRGGLYRIAGKDADALGKSPPVQQRQPKEGETAPEVTPEMVRDALRDVYDPEIPVNVVELGLIYDVQVKPHPEGGGSLVEVKMTLTAPGCGMGGIIASDAQYRIESLPGVREARVEIVWDPPWNQEMMTEAARLQLGLL